MGVKVKEPELGMFVARGYRYDHFAAHLSEYGVPEGEKALVSPGVPPKEAGGPSKSWGRGRGQEPIFGAQRGMTDRQDR